MMLSNQTIDIGKGDFMSIQGDTIPIDKTSLTGIFNNRILWHYLINAIKSGSIDLIHSFDACTVCNKSVRSYQLIKGICSTCRHPLINEDIEDYYNDLY